MNTLAVLYQKQGRYGEAEPLFKRALTIREKSGDSGNSNLALALENLAIVYDDQGRYGEAEPLYRRALAMREKTSGPEHESVAVELNNLGLLLVRVRRGQARRHDHRLRLSLRQE